MNLQKLVIAAAQGRVIPDSIHSWSRGKQICIGFREERGEAIVHRVLPRLMDAEFERPEPEPPDVNQ
jgi:hypothetical protein